MQLDLEALDLDAELLDGDGKFRVNDLISGHSWQWGAHNSVRLDPHVEPAYILHVQR